MNAVSPPDISVVMSVHNDEAGIERAAMSILSQTGVSLELIIIDDGSSDGCPDILQNLAARDPRVRVITLANRGLTHALIVGCGQARGRFIARQDSDDVSLPGRLRLQQELLQRDPGLAFVSCWSEVEGPGGETLVEHRRPTDSQEATEWLVRRRIGPPGHGSVMFRRDAYERVGGYRAFFYFAQDSDLWVRLAMVGRLSYVPELLYRYRVDPASISGGRTKIREEYHRLVNRLHLTRRAGEDEGSIIASASLLSPHGCPPTADARAATLYFIGSCLRNRNDPRALSYFCQALRQRPGHWRTWAMLLLTGVGRVWPRRGCAEAQERRST